MATNSAAKFDAPILGTDANDTIAVEHSISFQWVPAPGNAYTGYFEWPDWQTGAWLSSTTTGPSTASGSVTFKGVASSAPFQSRPLELDFRFTNGETVDLFQLTPSSGANSVGWTYDPSTGVLDPQNVFARWDNWVGVFLGVNEAHFDTAHFSGGTGDLDLGHWQLVPRIHNVDIFGGAGNDTILGGQGEETLDGGDGNDLIRASVGNDLLLGDAGNDELHGGIGTQILMGGTGNDALWGGTGSQMLLGDEGSDIIHGGSGQQTLMGGAGNDTLWGGSGMQFLEGGDGKNVLHAGIGNETLSGGSGRDTFVFSTAASGHDVIADFHFGQDIVAIAAGFGGLAIRHARDLLPHIASDPHGDAVLTVGSDFHLVLQHVAATQVETHLGEFFKIS